MGSFTEDGSAAREREPQSGDDRLLFPLGEILESTKFKASWRIGAFELWDTAAAETPAAAEKAIAEAEREREGTSGRALTGGFGG